METSLTLSLDEETDVKLDFDFFIYDFRTVICFTIINERKMQVKLISSSVLENLNLVKFNLTL